MLTLNDVIVPRWQVSPTLSADGFKVHDLLVGFADHCINQYALGEYDDIKFGKSEKSDYQQVAMAAFEDAIDRVGLNIALGEAVGTMKAVIEGEQITVDAETLRFHMFIPIENGDNTASGFVSIFHAVTALVGFCAEYSTGHLALWRSLPILKIEVTPDFRVAIFARARMFRFPLGAKIVTEEPASQVAA